MEANQEINCQCKANTQINVYTAFLLLIIFHLLLNCPSNRQLNIEIA